jgi:hypothetical protein
MLMKIALTADIHLTATSTHPERYNTLEDILREIEVEKIENLVIAGDLFLTTGKRMGDRIRSMELKCSESVKHNAEHGTIYKYGLDKPPFNISPIFNLQKILSVF